MIPEPIQFIIIWATIAVAVAYTLSWVLAYADHERKTLKAWRKAKAYANSLPAPKAGEHKYYEYYKPSPEIVYNEIESKWMVKPAKSSFMRKNK